MLQSEGRDRRMPRGMRLHRGLVTALGSQRAGDGRQTVEQPLVTHFRVQAVS